MHLCVVLLLDVVLVKLTRAVDVDLFESLLDKALSDWVHLSSDIPHEFIVGDLSVLVSVEQIEELSALFGGDGHSEVAQCLPELLDVQSAATIVIHDLENALHAEQATRTSRCQLLLKGLNKLIIGFLNATVVNSCGSLAIVHEGHVGITIGDVFTTSGHNHVGAVTLVSIRGRRVGLPLRALILRKHILLISSKEVPVVISPVGVPCAHC